MTLHLHGKSSSVAMTGLFASLIAVLDSTPMLPGFYSGVWDSWAFILSPLAGMLLGPVLGASSVLVGSVLGHVIMTRDPYESVFMFGAPVGAAVTGAVMQGHHRTVFAAYTLMFVPYLLTPVSRDLPLWGVWDTLGAWFLSVILCSKKRHSDSVDASFSVMTLCAAVLGLEADVLFRLFLLVPCQTYSLFYGLTPDQLAVLWAAASIIVPAKVALATVFTAALNKRLENVVART
ncbi:MAG: hypothetical protein HXY34_10315 [Candidatus Thorarchaeota archaeon]|nr:hypothetical protein [Candidatus Thorarchaeota archaeon]